MYNIIIFINNIYIMSQNYTISDSSLEFLNSAKTALTSMAKVTAKVLAATVGGAILLPNVADLITIGTDPGLMQASLLVGAATGAVGSASYLLINKYLEHTKEEQAMQDRSEELKARYPEIAHRIK
jgi:hypothetical protein